ncbi:MAG TPA: SMI1/KNR4 family protein [Actinomycetota bacterium]|nr:SMI1/KNR4 family protein [Actinomycetota bacterium]
MSNEHSDSLIGKNDRPWYSSAGKLIDRGDEMDQATFSRRVDEAKSSHPAWFDLPGDRRASETDLGWVEDAVGVRLPDDLRWFLATFGGGDFAFQCVFSADPTSHWYLLEQQPDRDPVDFVAFADDGTGNLFGFRVVGGEALEVVHILDHESNEIRPLSGEGFLAFLARTAFSTEA